MPPKPLFDRSEDHAYFQALEKLFIELRGAPFQLSPDDFKIAKHWRAEGIPLDVALSTLREKVEAAVEKGEEPKRRLSYYRRAVEGAWKRQGELLAPAAEAARPEIDVASRLDRLAARVPESLPAIRSRLADLGHEAREASGAADGSAEAVDQRLAALDQEMLDAARESLTEAERDDFEERVESAMAALSGRLGGASASARQRAETRLLREIAGLPLLSLFSPDALDDG